MEERIISTYDFHSPKRFTKERLRVFTEIMDNISKNLVSRLVSLLRVNSEVDIESFDEIKYFTYAGNIRDDIDHHITCLFGAYEKETDNQIFLLAMTINRNFVFYILDRMLGGEGKDIGDNRAFTDLEMHLINVYLEGLFDLFKIAAEPMFDLEFRFEYVETDPNYSNLTKMNNAVLDIKLRLLLDKVPKNIGFCIPETIIDYMILDSEDSSNDIVDVNTVDSQKQILSSIGQSEVDVCGVLGRTEISLEDLLSLGVGDVIKLNRQVEKGVILQIEGIDKLEGALGVDKNKNAVKIKNKL